MWAVHSSMSAGLRTRRHYDERCRGKAFFFFVFHFLLLTLADAGLLVQVVSSRTLALEAAKGVDAVAALAETRQFLALVDVWRTSYLD